VDGAYGLAFVSADEPGVLVAGAEGSPLLVGVGERRVVRRLRRVALLQHTRSVIYLDDGEMAVLSRDGYRIRNLEHGEDRKAGQSDRVGLWRPSSVAAYSHFMLKEICEQPESLRKHVAGPPARRRGYLAGQRLEPLGRRPEAGPSGSSSPPAAPRGISGLIGEYMLEEMARVPVDVEYASEFRYRNPVVDSKTLVIGISQSGETADTLAAIREAKRRGARHNRCGQRGGVNDRPEVDGGFYLHAGPEVGVASTKAFTSQVAALALISLRIARLGI
jgi:glucosamine--fructose-6-phosphate aminotransferase (isomerizing)